MLIGNMTKINAGKKKKKTHDYEIQFIIAKPFHNVRILSGV